MSEVVAAVEAVLSLPEEQLDYARTKIAFDRVIDPSIDEAWVLTELDRLTEAASELAGPSADEAARLNALRKLIYESGPWNGHRPFSYDHSDPLGVQKKENKLLANYLKNRLGQCVSMPILFLILGERLGLDLALATAPHHMFVRCRLKNGRTINLETTSGGHPARDEWMRRGFPMSDEAVKNGLYLRSLPRREGIAAMATSVLEHLMHERLYREAISASVFILEKHPRCCHAMLTYGTAYAFLMRLEIQQKYPNPLLIPIALRQRYFEYRERNQHAFEATEKLGWIDDGEEPE